MWSALFFMSGNQSCRAGVSRMKMSTEGRVIYTDLVGRGKTLDCAKRWGRNDVIRKDQMAILCRYGSKQAGWVETPCHPNRG